MIVSNFKKISPHLFREVKRYKLLYLSLLFIFAASLYLRVWRTGEVLGFYYDQGRDAQVIWDLIHNHRFFLIGPTTGIEGIYRGPWYYWLITPFYWLGRGNPVWPAVYLASTTVIASVLAYVLGVKIHSRLAGLIAAVISGFSFFLILAARWLSNPTPMMLLSMLLLGSVLLVISGRKWAWVLIGFLIGLAMQFGSATEVFYFPAVIIIGILNRDKLPSLKILLLSVASMLVVFLPQIIFDLRWNEVLSRAILKFLINDKTFGGTFVGTLKLRLPFYFDVFYSKIFPLTHKYRVVSAFLSSIFMVFFARSLMQNKNFQVLVILFFTPLLGMLFFRGNPGNIYDYYFTGYYLIFVLLFSTVAAELVKTNLFGALLVGVFILLFLRDNLEISKNYISDKGEGGTTINLRNQLRAVDWVLQDSKNREFNQDSYVPPVISYSYNYLFLWRANNNCGPDICNMQLDRRTPLLYTLYEVDPPHPERLEDWLARQKGIGEVEEEKQFGGITVQRRHRI